MARVFGVRICLSGWVTICVSSECPFIFVSSFGVYLSLTLVRLSLRPRVRRLLVSWVVCRVIFLVLLDSLLLHILLHLPTQLLTVELYILILEVTLTCILMQD